METVVQVLNWLAMIVPTLMATGLIAKYTPFMKNFSNNAIPLLNALIAFLTLFGGGAGTAVSGIFGDMGAIFSVPAKAIAALLVSHWTSGIYDRVLRPLLPPGPQPTR